MSDTMPTDAEITRAARLGALAARAGKRLLDDCPYPKDQRVLRARYALAFAAADPDRLVE